MPIWLVNVLTIICVTSIIISGFRGEKKLVSVGGWTIVPLIILGVPYIYGWGGVIFWLASMFVGFIIATFRNVVAEEKAKSGGFPNPNTSNDDELYDQALKLISETKKASPGLFQRRLQISYDRSTELLDKLESNGLVGPADEQNLRRVII